MKRLKILLDYDDVLFHFIEHLIIAINKEYNMNVSIEDIKGWEMEKYIPTLTKKEIFAPVFNEEFWRTVQPVKDGYWFISKLIGDGHRVKVVTSSFYQNVPAKMERLFGCYPMIEWNNVTITSDKDEVAGDVLIDDKPGNLEVGSYHKILMDKPHNRYYDTQANGMYKVNALMEAYPIIKKLAS